LVDNGINVLKTFVGEYATSMEMAGASLSLLRLDDEIRTLLEAPAFSPFLLQWKQP
jgi:dihydroxyacetone kinase